MQVFFQCSNAEGLVLIDRNGAEVEDAIEAHQVAKNIIHEFITSRNETDWRSWNLHVSDEDGNELFVMPFNIAIGRPQ